jgi:hypothetical protein
LSLAFNYPLEYPTVVHIYSNVLELKVSRFVTAVLLESRYKLVYEELCGCYEIDLFPIYFVLQVRQHPLSRSPRQDFVIGNTQGRCGTFGGRR